MIESNKKDKEAIKREEIKKKEETIRRRGNRNKERERKMICHSKEKIKEERELKKKKWVIAKKIK